MQAIGIESGASHAASMQLTAIPRRHLLHGIVQGSPMSQHAQLLFFAKLVARLSASHAFYDAAFGCLVVCWHIVSIFWLLPDRVVHGHLFSALMASSATFVCELAGTSADPPVDACLITLSSEVLGRFNVSMSVLKTMLRSGSTSFSLITESSLHNRAHRPLHTE